MKNLSYFILGLLTAWILHTSWVVWQEHSWFAWEWLSEEDSQRFLSIRLLLEVLLPAGGFLVVTYRFSLQRYPISALILGLAAFLLAYPVAWLLVEVFSILLDPGSEASTEEYVDYTKILNWLNEAAGFIAGICCGWLLIIRSRWISRERAAGE
ncbi:MAG: hypothetical protein PVF16_05620 [Chromatiales bacterium]|jgi:hypothetical protein